MTCDKCKRLCSSAKTNCMQLSGNKESHLLILGEAPGETEDNVGRQFVGRAGTYLNNHILIPAGLIRDEIAFDNAVRCRPPDNRTPSVSEMRNCREHVFAAIRELKPCVVLAVGNVALYSLLYLDKVKTNNEGEKVESGMSGITKWRGKKIWHRELNCWIVPALHPSNLMRSARERVFYPTKLTLEDFKFAFSLSCQKLPTQRYPETHVLNTKESILKFLLSDYLKSDVLAVDTESEDLDWFASPLYGVSFSVDPYVGYYLDFQTVDMFDFEIHNALKKVLSLERTVYVFHNAAHDIKFFKRNGLEVKGKLFDTMIAAHLLDENFYKGLKPLVWTNLNFGGYDHELDEYRREHKILKSFKGLTPDILSPYAAFDAVACRQLYDIFLKRLKEENLFTLFENIMIPVRNVFIGMEYRGFRVNRVHAQLLSNVLDRLEKKLETNIYAVAGKEFNINSNQQKQDLFFDVFKVPYIKLTKKGKERAKKPGYVLTNRDKSVDSDSLKYFLNLKSTGARLAELLLDYSYIVKQHGTFVKAILTHSKQHEDGEYYIHTSYNTTGTATLRISCTNPCTHNIVKDGLIMGMYLPRIGRVLVYADVKAAEVRVLAVEACEYELIEALRQGIDPHIQVWRMMFGKTQNDFPTKEERDDIKRVNFGIVYGMGIHALARRLGKSLEEAKRLYYLYFDQLPNVRPFFNRTYAELKKYGYIRTLFNSKRRLPGIYSDDIAVVERAKRQAVNTKIQTVAGLFTCVGLLRVESGLKAKKLEASTEVIHSVHDCGIFDTDIRVVDTVKEIVKNSFKKQLNILPIDMEVDINVLQNWGEGKKSRIADIIKKVGLEIYEDERRVLGEWIS